VSVFEALVERNAVKRQHFFTPVVFTGAAYLEEGPSGGSSIGTRSGSHAGSVGTVTSAFAAAWAPAAMSRSEYWESSRRARAEEGLLGARDRGELDVGTVLDALKEVNDFTSDE
jgi:hypothetical protein